MDSPQIVICGKGAERVRSLVERRSRIPIQLHLIDTSERLQSILPRPPLSLVVVVGEMIEDPIFQSWMKRRFSDLPLVLIENSREGRVEEDGLEGVTVLPEEDLSVLPYLVELACLSPCLPRRARGRENGPVPSRVPGEGRPGPSLPRPIVGRSQGIRRLLQSTRKVLNVGSSVLIVGESGTGKELVASMVHHESVRIGKPFVKVNCAAIPETLLESELFGIEKNTATGVDGRIGKFEQADGGTIFLDEIGDMSLLTQSKVLRILQEREFERVGGTRTVRVDVRIIAATNKDLPKEIQEKRFREDLYYRLNVINIRVPPLRERREDVPELAEHFVRYFCRENDLPTKRISGDTLHLLSRYSWPGNVRELENAIERAVVLGQGEVIRREDLPPHLIESLQVDRDTPENPHDLRRRVLEYEKSLLLSTLDETGWVQAKAARKLGITERSMWHLFKKHRLAGGSRKSRKRSSS